MPDRFGAVVFKLWLAFSVFIIVGCAWGASDDGVAVPIRGTDQADVLYGWPAAWYMVEHVTPLCLFMGALAAVVVWIIGRS